MDDYDGDGVPDVDDACPHVKHISKTSFLGYFTVDLYPGHSDPKPQWRVANMVKLVKPNRDFAKHFLISLMIKLKERKSQPRREFGYPVVISIYLDDLSSPFTP